MSQDPNSGLFRGKIIRLADLHPETLGLDLPLWLMDWMGSMIGGFSGQVGVAGRVFMSPLYVPFTVNITRFDHVLQVLGGAGTKLRLGIYDNGSLETSPKPDGGKLLFDSGDIAADAGLQKDVAVSLTLNQGWVFPCIETADATIQFSRRSGTGFVANQGTETMLGVHYDRGGGYGALIDPCPVTTLNGLARPCMYLRYVIPT